MFIFIILSQFFSSKLKPKFIWRGSPMSIFNSFSTFVSVYIPCNLNLYSIHLSYYRILCTEVVVHGAIWKSETILSYSSRSSIRIIILFDSNLVVTVWRFYSNNCWNFSTEIQCIKSSCGYFISIYTIELD